MSETDLTMAFKLTPSLLDQLSKALIELQSHSPATSDTVTFTEIRDHFLNLESKMLQKFHDLESKQKTFQQESLTTNQTLQTKLAEVAKKEQDMFDCVQILKDAAVAAIADARATHLPPPVHDLIDDVDNTNKTITPNSPDEIDDVDETEDNAVSFYNELTRFCDEMDAKGLVSFFKENRKNINILIDELSHVLKNTKEPGLLVLNALEGFYPNDDVIATRACIGLMEALSAMLARGEMGADVLLGLEIKQKAKGMADEWRPKLGALENENNENDKNENNDEKEGKSLEAEAFLQLLATFRIASEFDEDELCKLVYAVCERRHAPTLCRALGLAHKMPGVIEELVSRGKLISAVHFVHGFELGDRFPTVPLLKTYLKDLRRSSQGKRGNWGNMESGQNEGNAKELAALQNVVYCVQKYDLETEYPLEAIYRRVEQLEKAKVDRKRSRDPPSNRFRDSPTKHHHQNKKRSRGGGGGGGYGHHRRHGAASNGRHPPHPAYLDRSLYAAQPGERYDSYSYPPPAQAAYSQQVYEQSAYYYPPPDAAVAPPVAAPPAAYQPPPYQPYTYQ